MPNEKANVRTVSVRGAHYLRAEDVAELIRNIASTEETDVRNRLNQFAGNIQAMGDRCTACSEPSTRICDVRKGVHTCGLPLCSECVHDDACWKGVGAKTTKKNGQPR